VRSNEESKSNPISSSTRFNRNGKGKSKIGAAQFLYNRYVGSDSGKAAEYEEELLNAEIARRIFQLRTKAGLSQRDLARRIGTSASAICRLEHADYEGHSLALLKRIAGALEQRVEIRFVPARRSRTSRPG
jgi:ribosome-binding protein aMBF1 (putative translation factor)